MADRQDPGRMDVALFWKGMLIGLAIAAPVGPIGVLCIRRTLAEGQPAGFAVGLGAATADACYGAIAAFGITAISARLVAQQELFRLGGGAVLLYLGWRTLRATPVAGESPLQARGLLAVYGSSLLLTLTNPATILSFVALFAGIGLVEAAGARGSALMVVLGVFLGSACWWLFLTTSLRVVRRALTPARLVWINRLSGGVLLLFGLLAVGSIV